MKVFDHIWLWLILLFAGYVLVAGTPEGRIVRLCEPVNWGGRVFESLTLLVVPQSAPGVRNSVNSTERGCHAVVYRQIYPEQYQAAKDAAEKNAVAKEASAKGVAATDKKEAAPQVPAEPKKAAN
jgi:hypothetical protein